MEFTNKNRNRSEDNFLERESFFNQESAGINMRESIQIPLKEGEEFDITKITYMEEEEYPLEFEFRNSFAFPERTIDGDPSTGAFVLATGSAFAKRKYSTQEVFEAFVRQRESIGDTSFDHNFVQRVFEGCTFDTHSIMLPLEKLFQPMTREEYLLHRRVNLKALAEEAARNALERWGGDKKDITHLFWGTMTGAMDSPTIDIQLTVSLGLSYDVKRTSIEGMGCLTGYRLLNLAREVIKGNPNARILVVAADLRSALQNSLPRDLTRSDIVSVALFRDAASAAVIGGNPFAHEKAYFEIMASKSRILPDTQHIVDYTELNEGAIRLYLSIELRDIIAREEPAFVTDLLEEASNWQRVRDNRQELLPPLPDWDIAVHTGGPRVLDGICRAFGSTKERFRASWKVMKENGNLSGASNLAVLHEQTLLPDCSPWVLGLSMGPGVCLEGVVFRRMF